MGTLSQNLVQRAQIFLLLNAGQSSKEVMESLEVSSPTVFKWRNRHIEKGLEGLHDAPRLGQPRKLDKKRSKPFSTTQCTRFRVAPPIGVSG